MLGIKTDDGCWFTWYVGDGHTMQFFEPGDPLTFIEMVQADRHELEAIAIQFPTLPIPVNKQVVRWYGDQARFIVGNME